MWGACLGARFGVTPARVPPLARERQCRANGLQLDLRPVRCAYSLSDPISIMQGKRTSLADPARGLVWSNPNVSDEVLVRLALRYGAYHFVLDAVLDFGLAYVREQWLLMLEDEDAIPPKDACVDVERKLANIERGLRSVGL